MTDETQAPASAAWQTLWLAALGVGVAAIASGFLILSRADKVTPHVAEFACPDIGTVLVIARPLALSADPGKTWRWRMLERDGFACRFSNEKGDYWLYGGLTESPYLEWRAATEELWPLKVGNATHARFVVDNQIWSVDYKVVAFEKYAARLGTFADQHVRLNADMHVAGKQFRPIRHFRREKHIIGIRVSQLDDPPGHAVGRA